MVHVNTRLIVMPKGFAAVGGAVQRDPEHVNALGVIRVDANLSKVKRAGTEVVHLGPRVATVDRSKDAAGLLPITGGGILTAHIADVGQFGLNDGIEDAWVLAVHG